MNIQTVAENLRNTIAGKEELLEHMRSRLVPHPAPDDAAHFSTKILVPFLEDNIAELKRILQDVELCMNHADANSWVGEVDRQGGSFTAEELDPNRGWK